MFAPRQTGKTTFFRLALETLTTQDSTYFPIHLNFEEYEDYDLASFYVSLRKEICKEIERVFQKRETDPSDELASFLVNTEITDHVSMREFFEGFAKFLSQGRVVLTIDEFDAIPRAALKGFLRSLRYIYLSGQTDAHTALVLLVLKVSHNLTTIDPFPRSISKMNSICRTSRLNRCKNYLGNIQTKSGSPSHQK